MKIAISAGHNVYVGKYFDPGAVNIPYVEADINKQTVAILIPLLRQQGHTVIDVTPYDEKFVTKIDHHKLRCKRVDEFKADLYLDIHINAGGGTGPEIWVHNMDSKSVSYAKKIVDTLSANLELKNRGVRVNPTYWSLYLCEAPAMIIEGAFIDTKEDMEKLTPEKYALSIAECFGEVKTESNILYKVQVGAYRDKANAEKFIDELKGLGYNGIIVEEGKKEVEAAAGSKSKYYKTSDGLEVIETDKENVYVAILPGTTLREFGIYGINGTWQDNANTKDSRSIWGLAMNNNKIIGPNSLTNSPKGFKRGTVICYADGTLEVKRVNSSSEIGKPVKWAIGGGMLYPDYNPTIEGYTASNNAADVLRVTAHTALGFKDDKIYLIVHKNCSMNEFRNMIDKLYLEGCIFLDGGGSTQMNYIGDKGISSSRKLSHGIFIKEV